MFNELFMVFISYGICSLGIGVVIGWLLRGIKESKEQIELEICPICGGSGFSGYGTGYDDVCDYCGGLREVPKEYK